MTIAVLVKVNDGIVLAADSASALVTHGTGSTPQVVNVYNNANKVFNLAKGLPVGVVTYGAGSIGAASISTLLKDFRDELTQPGTGRLNEKGYSIRDIAERLKRFIFDDLYSNAFADWPHKPALGFIVAGYSAGGSMAEEYVLEVTDGICADARPVRDISETGVTWHGEGEAIHRLLLGTGTGLPRVLEQNLGVPPEQIGRAMQVIGQALTLPVTADAMPLQDAIDLAEFLVNLTIKTSRFTPGAPTVGGPIEIAAISKHEHFKWISRKLYYSKEYNPEEISWSKEKEQTPGTSQSDPQ